MPFLQTLGGGSVSGFRVTNNEFEPEVEATGGIEYVWFDSDGYKHKTHMFMDNGNWVCTKNNGPIAFALVAGGGGGAGGHDQDWYGGAGGGAGGVVYSTAYTNYTATSHGSSLGGGGDGGVGAPQGQGSGSANNGNNGGNTNFFGFQANGGGGGGRSGQSNDAKDGGCGGGSGSNTSQPSAGSSNQNTYGSNNVVGIGYAGGNGETGGSYPYGGAGGGAGGIGGNYVSNNSNNKQQGGGSGGAAIDLKFVFGGETSQFAAGGGGGGAGTPPDAGNGGQGGDSGYTGDSYNTAIAGGQVGGTGRGGDCGWGMRDGSSGTDGLGGGGGGGCGGWQGGSPNSEDNTGRGGDGGQGLVGVSYKISESETLGNSQSNPATSARAIKAANSTAETGIYWIKPSGYGGSAFEVFCDMDTDGGGWMHVATFWDDHRTRIMGEDGAGWQNSFAQYKWMWGYFLHRTDSGNYTSSSSHGGRFTDDEYNMLGSIGWPGNFGKNFKHPQLYASASLNQVMMKDQGARLRKLWYTETFTSVADTRVFFGRGNNMWVDAGTQRNSSGGGFRRLSVTSYSQGDDVFGNATTIYFGFGEPSGTEESNQDRSMITPQGLNSESVSATQGIGVSRANGSGYQRARNIDDQFRDEPGNFDDGSQYSYTLWIRDTN
tara:strand:- start:174 stop:2141 length:1968 start_codon:yes stop_codon:yes gene_type:complete